MTNFLDRDHLIGEILFMNSKGAKAAGASHEAANPINTLRHLEREDDAEIIRIHQVLSNVVGMKG